MHKSKVELTLRVQFSFFLMIFLLKLLKYVYIQLIRRMYAGDDNLHLSHKKLIKRISLKGNPLGGKFKNWILQCAIYFNLFRNQSSKLENVVKTALRGERARVSFDAEL